MVLTLRSGREIGASLLRASSTRAANVKPTTLTRPSGCETVASVRVAVVGQSLAPGASGQHLQQLVRVRRGAPARLRRPRADAAARVGACGSGGPARAARAIRRVSGAAAALRR